MPYFIYRVFPFRRLEKVTRAALVPRARRRGRRRCAQAPTCLPDCAIKVIFAATELEAEDLLTQVREPAPGVVGDE